MSSTLLLASLLLAAPQAQTASCCGMEQFANDPAFLAFHLPPVDIHFQATTGKTVTYNDVTGKSTSGFYVAPKVGKHAAVIMIHEFWGLNDNIRNAAEWLNGKTGYGVLAVDLYEGQSTKDPKEAGQLMQSVDKERAKAIVKGAVDALRGGDIEGNKATKIGVVGFCFGGGWSFQTAVLGGKDVNACSVFYGMPDTSEEALTSVHAPVVFNEADQDKWITPKVAEDFAAKMRAHGKKVTVYHYNAAHAFANPSNPKYDKKSADLAWKRTLALFKKNLG